MWGSRTVKFDNALGNHSSNWKTSFIFFRTVDLIIVIFFSFDQVLLLNTTLKIANRRKVAVLTCKDPSFEATSKKRSLGVTSTCRVVTNWPRSEEMHSFEVISKTCTQRLYVPESKMKRRRNKCDTIDCWRCNLLKTSQTPDLLDLNFDQSYKHQF